MDLMQQKTREQIIYKLGTLDLANAELGAVNEVLLKQLHEAQARIAQLEATIKELSFALPAKGGPGEGEDVSHPSNPYEAHARSNGGGNGAAH